MLHQYLKDNSSVGDLSLDRACNLQQQQQQQQQPKGNLEMLRPKSAQMSCFPFMDNSRSLQPKPRDFKCMDLFPQQAGFGPPPPREDVPKMTDFSSVKKAASAEPQRAPMTIFYGGQVIVFNDFPADKAKEIILLARKESSQSHTTQTSIPIKSKNGFSSHVGKNRMNTNVSASPCPNMFNKFGNQVIQEGIKASPRPIGCDLPIARKASLHRFLEKRKDRINKKAPYQISSPAGCQEKPAGSKSWLELAAQQTR